jgi:hypothetical protein
MTQFFYGTVVEEAMLIAKRGAILSPVKMEGAWLQDLKQTEKEYYDDLLKGKTLDQVAKELALTNVLAKDNIEQILLTHSVSLAVLRLARSKEPKIVLGVNVHHPPAQFISLPGPIYLDQLEDVRLYEEAVEQKSDIINAFKKYTKNFYLVKKK